MAKHAKRREKHSKKKSFLEKFISSIFLIIIIVAILVSIYKIITWFIDIRKNNEIIEEISHSVTVNEEKENEDRYDINFERLKQINESTVAWLKVKGTKIEYPVVKASDNDYYLKRSFDKTQNSAGWIFADYRNKFDNTDKNIVIYGHNMKDESMFCTLKNVIKQEWYEKEENRKITFITEYGQFEYQVFSVYQIDKDKYDNSTNFSSNKRFQDYINNIKRRSVYNFDVEVTSKDSILTLYTCANNNKYRVILHAVKINKEINQ